jgi:hypothetical protein
MNSHRGGIIQHTLVTTPLERSLLGGGTFKLMMRMMLPLVLHLYYRSNPAWAVIIQNFNGCPHKNTTAQRQASLLINDHANILAKEYLQQKYWKWDRAPLRNSIQIITPFVRVGLCLTRNFATLGPL